MLETKLQETAFGILRDKITDEEEKNRISKALHELEENLDSKIAGILHELRWRLDSGELSSKFSSSDRDSIIKKVGENIKRSEYTGV